MRRGLLLQDWAGEPPLLATEDELEDEPAYGWFRIGSGQHKGEFVSHKLGVPW